MAKRVVCHSHFPHVRDSYSMAVKREWKPTKIKYNAREKGFCFSYQTSAVRGPYGQKGH